MENYPRNIFGLHLKLTPLPSLRKHRGGPKWNKGISADKSRAVGNDHADGRGAGTEEPAPHPAPGLLGPRLLFNIFR